MKEAVLNSVQPEWSVLSDAIETWLIGVLAEDTCKPVVSGTIVIPQDTAAILSKEFSNACRIPEFSIKGVKVVDKSAKQIGPLEPIPSEHFRLPRDFRPHLNLIESHSDDQSIHEFNESRQGGERHPDWVDVVVHSNQFLVWLSRWLTDYLVTEIYDGRLMPDEANRRLRLLGFECIHEEPDPGDFVSEVSKEIYWTLPMTVAWISTRSMIAVAGQHDSFDQKTGHWSENPPGLIWVNSKGPSLQKLMMREAMRSEDHIEEEVAQFTVKQAREELWRKLQSGELDAIGSVRHGAPEIIPSFKWVGLHLGMGVRGPEWVSPKHSSVESDKIYDLKFLSSKVKELWRPTDETSPEKSKDIVQQVNEWPATKLGAALNDDFENKTHDLTPSDSVPPIVPTNNIPELPTLSDEELARSYKERVVELEAAGAIPDREDDYNWLCSISRQITHLMARKIRKENAPEHWVTPGRRKTRI